MYTTHWLRGWLLRILHNIFTELDDFTYGRFYVWSQLWEVNLLAYKDTYKKRC